MSYGINSKKGILAMQINFSSPLTDLTGKPLLDGEEAVTLATLSINSLLMTLQNHAGQPETLSGQEKVRHAALAQRIHDATDKVDVTVEDVALIKDRIGRAYAPLAVMRAWSLLDPVASDAAKVKE